MDQLADKNFLTRGIVGFAKKLKNVQSYYRIESTAVIKGTSLDAIASSPIKII